MKDKSDIILEKVESIIDNHLHGIQSSMDSLNGKFDALIKQISELSENTTNMLIELNNKFSDNQNILIK